jgi:hypothetical protein
MSLRRLSYAKGSDMNKQPYSTKETEDRNVQFDESNDNN